MEQVDSKNVLYLFSYNLGSGVYDVQVQVLLSAGMVKKPDFVGFLSEKESFLLMGERLFFSLTSTVTSTGGGRRFCDD